jgi:hypothetical protein
MADDHVGAVQPTEREAPVSTPIDGWFRNQQTLLPELDAECEVQITKLMKRIDAVQRARRVIRDTAETLHIPLPAISGGDYGNRKEQAEGA